MPRDQDKKPTEDEILSLLSREACSSFKGVRKVVGKLAVREAQELMKQGVPFREAMSQGFTNAWSEVKRQCLVKYGVSV